MTGPTGYDVIVLGLGGIGSAAAAHLAARGARVLGLEQFGPAHDRGSSHGDTRVIRQSYFESPAYVPLLIRAFELWADLDTDDPGLFTPTGGLMIGRPDSAPVSGALSAARAWQLPHEILGPAEMTTRFPQFRLGADEVAFHENHAGFVRPERTVLAHLARARAAGADLRFETPALSWTAGSDNVTVRTESGLLHADHLVVTPGAWAPTVLADLGLPLVIERQLLFWFDPPAGTAAFAPGRQPIFIWETPDGLQLYGFPALDGPGGGVKFAFYRHGTAADPDHLDREIHPAEIDFMASHLATMLPGAAGAFLRGRACLYTTTPDLAFVIGTHPEHANVTVAAGFSGHGFKFVPVVGEILADLALSGSTPHPIDLFDPTRFR